MSVKLHHSSLILLAAGLAFAQEKPLKFTGEVKAKQEFRKPIGRGLVFLLKADEDGWIVEVQPEAARGESCRNYSTVIATPLRGYTANDLNVSYGMTAAKAVQFTPREVSFVLDGTSCRLESERVNRLSWPQSYPAAEVEAAGKGFGSSAGGRATLRIVQSKLAGAGEDARIDWLKFEVEVIFLSKP